MTKDLTIRSAVIPPPVQGWNTRDPISAMDALYAVEIENFIAYGGKVAVRNGSTQFATLGSAVFAEKALGSSEYAASSGSRYAVSVLISGGNAYPYSIDTGGATTNISGGVSVAASADTIFFCQYKNRIYIKSKGNTFDVYHWTGTGNIAASGFVGPSLDDKALGYMCIHKNRMYFCGLDSQIWYTAYDSFGSTLTSYDLGSLMPNGGSVMFCEAISPNPANNREQFLVVVTTTGDVLLFSGTYPGSTDWSIVGTYYAGSPVGYRSLIKFQNDILLITKQGLVSVLSLMNGSALEDSYLSDIVGSAFTEYVNSALSGSSPDLIGGVYYPSGNYILISFPNYVSGDYKQFTFYTKNKSWWLFSGYTTPYLWFTFNNGIYFSGLNYGNIYKADNGDYDINASGSPASRSLKMRPAYNFLGSSSRKKRFLFAVPHMYQSEGMQLTMDADVDFQNVAATQTVTPDNTDTSYKYYAPKVGLAAVGKCASIRIDQTVTTKRMSIEAIEVYWEEGGVL